MTMTSPRPASRLPQAICRFLAAACFLASVHSPSLGQQQAPARIADARPGEVRLLISNGLRLPFEAVRADAEKALGKTFVVEYGSSNALKGEIEASQPFEAAILTAQVIDEMIGKDKLAKGSRVDLAMVAVGVAQRGDAPAKDISTPEAFKAALTGAKSVRYLGTGASQPTVINAVAKLGLTETLKARLDSSSASQALETVKLSRGEYELLLNLDSELMPVSGWTYLGSIPQSLQVPVIMSAGVGPRGDAAAARALIDFLRGPALAPALKASRMTLAPPAAAPPAAAGPTPPPPAPQAMTVHTIKDGKIYWVEGGGGNSGVVIGKTGVIVIDAKITADAGRQLIAEVAKLTPKPITHVIITHSDGDHVNGLAGFPDGLQIIAHANNKAEQQAVYLYAAVEIDGGKCLPPANRLPNRVVVKDKVATTLAGEAVQLLHFGPAHTSGDLVIYLPDEKVAFTGDLITSNVLIHPEKSGSLEGWFRNANALLALGATQYIGGHAREPDTKASLRKRIADYQAIRGKVDGLMKDGKTLADIKTAMGDPAKNPSGCRGIPYPSLAEVEYAEQQVRDQELK